MQSKTCRFRLARRDVHDPCTMDCCISYDVVSTEPVRNAAHSGDLLSHSFDRIDSEFDEAWHSIRIESTEALFDSSRIYQGRIRFASSLPGLYSIRIDWGLIRIEC